MNTKDIQALIEQETDRQRDGLVMIASENYASQEVLSAMGTPLSNKYSEGYPGQRYYTGNQFIDIIESTAKDLSLEIFGLDSEHWHANVQPHSGSSANIASYMALLSPGDTILAMDLGAGGHLTHGSKVNFSGQIFNFAHYGVDPKTGKFDYDEILRVAKSTMPKLIVCGATAYTQEIDFKKFKDIAEEVDAFLLADISHIAGLIVAGVHQSPFPHADIVTTTTHKTLRGPRGAIIICKSGIAKSIDKAVFPGLQGGPLENVIAAKAICFSLALEDSFKQDQLQTVNNAQMLAKVLLTRNINLVADSTQNHLLLIDCQSLNISGKVGADALAKAGIYTNANMIPFDPSTPLNPSGIRIGTPALTTRGMGEPQMQLIAGWIADILLDHSNQDLLDDISAKVKDLTHKFPIY
jgi:glycine hydroxymethyltransferase